MAVLNNEFDKVEAPAISLCVRIVVASIFHQNKTGSGKLVMSEALPRRAQASCH